MLCPSCSSENSTPGGRFLLRVAKFNASGRVLDIIGTFMFISFRFVIDELFHIYISVIKTLKQKIASNFFFNFTF